MTKSWILNNKSLVNPKLLVVNKKKLVIWKMKFLNKNNLTIILTKTSKIFKNNLMIKEMLLSKKIMRKNLFQMILNNWETNSRLKMLFSKKILLMMMMSINWVIALKIFKPIITTNNKMTKSSKKTSHSYKTN